MTSTCWPWSTLEKACLKRAMALHRDSGRSEAACAKAELCSRISWQHGTLGGRPGPPFLPLIGWTKFYATFHWTSNSHLVMTAQCNSTLWLVSYRVGGFHLLSAFKGYEISWGFNIFFFPPHKLWQQYGHLYLILFKIILKKYSASGMYTGSPIDRILLNVLPRSLN